MLRGNSVKPGSAGIERWSNQLAKHHHRLSLSSPPTTSNIQVAVTSHVVSTSQARAARYPSFSATLNATARTSNPAAVVTKRKGGWATSTFRRSRSASVGKHSSVEVVRKNEIETDQHEAPVAHADEQLSNE